MMLDMKLFGAISACLISLFVFSAQVHAADINDVSVEFDITINEDGSTAVRQIVSGDAAAGAKIKLPIIATPASEVTVRMGENKDTNQLQIIKEGSRRLGLNTQNQFIELDIPNNKGWQATLTYQDAIIVTEIGTYLSISINPFSDSYANEKITIYMPISEALPVSYGLEPEESSVRDGVQSYVFVTSGQRDKAISLTYGTTVTYATTQKYTLKNSGWWWRDYQIVLPPDSNQQTVAVQSVSREPKSMRIDQDGNIIMTYRVGPKKTVSVEAEIRAQIKSFRYKLPQSLEAAGDGFADYLAPIGAWSSGVAVEAFSPEEALNILINRSVQGYDQDKSSDQVVNQLIADARASGIPARFMKGLVVQNSPVSASSPTVALPHVWAELYFEGSGWITLDPSYASTYNSAALVDAMHIVQKVYGVSDTEPQSEPAEVSALTTTDDVIEPSEVAVSQVRYLILPGLSYVKTAVTMDSGAVRDNVGFSDGASTTPLGSLSPLQSISFWSWATGADSWATPQVAVGTVSDDTLVEQLGVSDAELSFVALGVLVLIVASMVFISKRYDTRNNTVRIAEPDDIDDRSPEELLDKYYLPNPVKLPGNSN